MADVSIRNVTKSFGKVEVIHDISCDIRDGEFIVILGPSGCGKSTLLRLVAGLEEISSGEIAIAGRVVNELEPAARDIAMVFQNYALYPHMTVFENMSFGLRLRHIPKKRLFRGSVKPPIYWGLNACLTVSPASCPEENASAWR